MNGLRIEARDDHVMNFRLVNYEFTVSCDSDETAEVIASLLEPCRVDCVRRPINRYELQRQAAGDETILDFIVDGNRLARCARGVVVDQLIVETTRRSFAEGDFVFVHAGVAARDGRAILLSAAGGHGKSTTVAGLVRAGFDFLSDEVAALELATAAVHPFPRPMMLSGSSLDSLPGLKMALPDAYEAFRSEKFRMAPDDVRPGSLGVASRVGFVVVPYYEGASETRLESMSRPDALCALVQQNFNLDRFGARGFQLLADVVRGAECFRLTIGDLGAAVEAVEALFDLGRSE